MSIKKSVDPDGVHPYKLVLPKSMHAELKVEAKRQHRSLLDLIRRYLRMGLELDRKKRKPDTSFIIKREGELDEEIFFP